MSSNFNRTQLFTDIELCVENLLHPWKIKIRQSKLSSLWTHTWIYLRHILDRILSRFRFPPVPQFVYNFLEDLAHLWGKDESFILLPHGYSLPWRQLNYFVGVQVLLSDLCGDKNIHWNLILNREEHSTLSAEIWYSL